MNPEPTPPSASEDLECFQRRKYRIHCNLGPAYVLQFTVDDILSTMWLAREKLLASWNPETNVPWVKYLGANLERRVHDVLCSQRVMFRSSRGNSSARLAFEEERVDGWGVRPSSTSGQDSGITRSSDWIVGYDVLWMDEDTQQPLDTAVLEDEVRHVMSLVPSDIATVYRYFLRGRNWSEACAEAGIKRLRLHYYNDKHFRHRREQFR